MKSYLLTLKNNSLKAITHSQLVSEIAIVKELLKGADWHDIEAFELDDRCRLHYHTLIKFSNNISCQKYCRQYKHDGYIIHLQPIPAGDLNNAVKYIQKEKRSVVELEEIAYEYYLKKKLKKVNLFTKLLPRVPCCNNLNILKIF